MFTVFRRHPYLTGALALTAALALFFAVRFVAGVIYWSAHENEPIRPWMTVGYIGRSWDLNPRVLNDAAGLPKPEGHPLTLAEIADQRGVPVAEVIAGVEAALAQLKGPTE